MGAELLEQGERLIARPHGRMDEAGGAELAAAAEQRLRAGTKSMTIELDALDFVSLGGVRSLLRLARSLKKGGASLDFTGGSEAVREALRQAGFDELFAFAPPFHSHRGTRQ